MLAVQSQFSFNSMSDNSAHAHVMMLLMGSFWQTRFTENVRKPATPLLCLVTRFGQVTGLVVLAENVENR